MTRNLIVLGCAGMLAIGLSLTSFAGIDPDDDLDGATNSNDNCTQIANANGNGDIPNATPLCIAQEDGDTDGYGNPCDTDVNQDGAAGLSDVGFVLGDAKVGGTNPAYDFNCDGASGLDDVGRVLAQSKIGLTPGPSGLACAGTVPCP